MLEKIALKNFQSHKKTELELNPGINAITGTSDAGKSSILRAIKFLATNRPRGTAFISHSKNETEVELEFDGTAVSRKRGKKNNSYKLGNQSFDVVKSDVPDEVTQFLNFSETTIQSQHDKYFLLQDTAGEVAKKLNKVAGLDIIDHVMREVNSDINENKRDIKYTKGRIDDLEAEIKEYDNLDKAETLLSDLNEKMDKHKELLDLLCGIDQACQKIESTNETIEILDGWLKIEEPFMGIIQSCKRLDELLSTKESLVAAITEVEVSKEQIERLSDQAGYEETVKGILGYGLEREQLDVGFWNLENAIAEIETNQDNIESHTITIEELTKDAVYLIKENKLCPLCGGKVDDNTLEHIHGWI
jgi:DNA repair protein SbcC/Rad50